MPPLKVRRVTVLPERVEFTVEFERTDSAGADAVGRVLDLLPGIGRHRCSEGFLAGGTGVARADTVPHLFEHVVLEIMALAGSPRTVLGATEWRKGDDIFRISVLDDDDVVCLGAAKLGLAVLAYATGEGEKPEVEDEVARLASLRPTPNRHP